VLLPYRRATGARQPGRLRGKTHIHEDFDTLPEDIARVRELEMVHRDPFDRLLIAQAIEEGLTLLTADDRIPAYPVRCLLN
jgi:PIN domain nuclease of toxin-antitoxin system